MSCFTGRNFVDYIRGQLLDCEEGEADRRWKEKDLIDYLNAAMAAVLIYRPDAFPSRQKIKLEPGAIQTMPAGASSILAVHGTKYTLNGKDFSCGDSSQITKVDSGILDIYSSRRCAKATEASTSTTLTDEQKAKELCGAYAITGYDYKVAAGRTFTVSPPVPDGVTVYADVTLGTCPICLDDSTLDTEITCEFAEPIKKYAMSEAFGRDTEDATSAAKAAGYLSAFNAMMGVDIRVKSRQGSGYYLGENGEGDPRVTRG